MCIRKHMGKRKICIILITFSLLMCNITNISASSEVEFESMRGPLFGGVVIDPSEIIVDLPLSRELVSDQDIVMKVEILLVL